MFSSESSPPGEQSPDLEPKIDGNCRRAILEGRIIISPLVSGRIAFEETVSMAAANLLLDPLVRSTFSSFHTGSRSMHFACFQGVCVAFCILGLSALGVADCFTHLFRTRDW